MAQPAPAPQAPIDPPVLQLVEGVPTTTSRYVAQYFGRHHRDVMRTIRTLIDTDESCLRNFAQVERAIQNHNGGAVDYPEYTMGEEGFMLLAMGFTGRKALALKLAFLAEFRRMRTELQAKSDSSRREISAVSYQNSSSMPPEKVVLAAASFAGHLQYEIARALLAGQSSDFQSDRFMVTITHYDDRGWQPYIKRLDEGALCLNWDGLVKLMRDPGGWHPSDAQAAEMQRALADIQLNRATSRARSEAAALTVRRPDQPASR